MLLRTVVVFLLCVSMGTCATLGLYQTQSNEEEAPASNSAAVTEAVVAAASVDDVAAADNQVGDSSAANTLFGDQLLAKILSVDNPAGTKPEVDVPVADSAAAEEPGAGRPATEGAVNQGQTSSEEEWNEIRPVKINQSLDRPLIHEDDGSWSLNSIRNSFQTMHGYFDSVVELVGGHNGVCEYRCKYGDHPEPRPAYQIPEPNGCSSSLVGFQLDLGIPAMTNCCNQLDICYDTCGSNKYNCDSKFRLCLHNICSDLKKSLGFVSKVQACESMADALYNTVWTLGCRPYMNSQRAACVCKGEDRDEL